MLGAEQVLGAGCLHFPPCVFCYSSKIGLVLAWIILLILAYRVSLIEIEHKEYDPFAVLDVDRVCI